MKSRTRVWLPRLAFGFAVAVAIYAFFPVLREALGAGVGLAMALVYVAAFLFAIAALPLGFLWLAMFVYSIFLRPYLRAWHISRIRSARYLREASQRRREGS